MYCTTYAIIIQYSIVQTIDHAEAICCRWASRASRGNWKRLWWRCRAFTIWGTAVASTLSATRAYATSTAQCATCASISRATRVRFSTRRSARSDWRASTASLRSTSRWAAGPTRATTPSVGASSISRAELICSQRMLIIYGQCRSSRASLFIYVRISNILGAFILISDYL